MAILSSSLFGIAKSLIHTGLIFVASVSVLSLAAIYVFQRKLVYPSSLNEARVKVDTPKSLNLPYEDIIIETEDGENLQSFLLLHDSNDLNYTNKTILILSPNAGNIGMFLPIVHHIYRNLNYNVFIYSYRGYGHSTGSPSEAGLKKDADSVMKYIANHRQLSQSSIIPYGRSLGGAVAIYIASHYGDQISGLVLENTFLHIHKLIPYIFPFLAPFAWLCTEKWNSEEDVKMIRPDIPCLFLSGSEDEIVPPEHMKIMYETIGSNPKVSGYERTGTKIWREFKATHNNTIVAPGYWDTWEEFIRNLVNPIGK